MKPLLMAISLFLMCCSLSAEAEETECITYTVLDWPPMAYSTPEGAKGLYIDILKEIFEKNMGIKLDTRFLPWKRAQQQVRDGQSDFLLTAPTTTRAQYAEPSKSTFFQMYLYVYTYKNHPKLSQIAKIKKAEDIKHWNLTVAANHGNDWIKQNIEKFGVETHYIKKIESLPRFVAKQRADLMVEFIFAMNYQIKKLGLENQIEQTNARFGPLNIHLLMSKKSKYRHLLPEIDETFARLKRSGKIDEIISKYMEQ